MENVRVVVSFCNTTIRRKFFFFVFRFVFKINFAGKGLNLNKSLTEALAFEILV